MNRTSKYRTRRQRGSALLIVFVFAAMLAIMLYRAMPVAVFEAQRRKEELLIDRGNEYKHAIKLYVRKFQTFPASLDALENTNRMRFLRSRYTDPFSGKDEWRFLHAGPGGMILDSKIKQNQLGPHAATDASNALGSPATASGFGNSGGVGGTATGLPAAAAPDGQAAAPNGFPQRPSTIALRAGIANPGATDPAIAAAVQNGDAAEPQIQAPDVPNGSAAPYPGYPGPPNPAVPGQSAAQASSTDPQSMMKALLNNQNPASPLQATAAPGATQQTGTGAVATNASRTNTPMGGGIAGIASKSLGHTIKVLNDQSDISLWEFVYDLRQEATANLPVNLQGNANGNANGQAGANQNNTLGTGIGISTTPPISAPPPPNSTAPTPNP